MTPLRTLCFGLALLLPLAGSAAAQSADGAALLRDGQTARAIAQLEEALGRNPFDAVVLNNLAAAYAERGDYPRASELLRRAHRLAPGDATIRENLEATERWLARMAQRGSEQPRRRSDAAEPVRVPPEPPSLWR